MDRQADHSIKGFLYQFLLTIKTILTSEDDVEIICEGIEDVDICEDNTIIAMQCKYHESVENFTLSNIYKPVLQMMIHFSKNPTMFIKYHLYSYFPNEQMGIRQITKQNCEEILKSRNKSYKTMIQEVQGLDIDAFINKFELHIGFSYEEMLIHIYSQLLKEGFSQIEIDNIIFPNMIYYISELSVKKMEIDRRITKKILLQKVRTQKKLLCSKWLDEMKSFDALIKSKRLILQDTLNNHLRRRVFIFSNTLSQKTDHIVTFIGEIIQKFYSSHLDKFEPIVCLDLPAEQFNETIRRLYHNGLICWDGYVAGEFIPARFKQAPPNIYIGKKMFKKEFHLKILNREHMYVIPNCEDYYILDNDINDVEINEAKKEIINFNHFGYLRYIFHLRKGYEYVG